MDHDQIVAHMDTRFDRVEDKLDAHLEQISANKEAINWLKGHVKVSITIALTILSAVVAAYINQLG